MTIIIMVIVMIIVNGIMIICTMVKANMEYRNTHTKIQKEKTNIVDTKIQTENELDETESNEHDVAVIKQV